MSEIIVATPAEIKLLLLDVLNDWIAANGLFSGPSESNSSTKAEKANRKNAAEYLGISLVTLGEHTKKGTIKGKRIGRRVLYEWADLDAALSTINTGGGK